MTPEETQCAELVRRGDPDRFLSIMAIAPKFRADLFVIYAFNLEVARAPWVTKEALIAEMRLQWWLDAIEEIFDGKQTRKHEVVTPLSEVIKRHSLPRESFDNLINARRWDIYSDPHSDTAAMQSYVQDTSGHLILACIIAGVDRNSVDLEKASYAAGLAAYLQAIPKLTDAQKVPLVDGRPDAISAISADACRTLRANRKSIRDSSGTVFRRLTWMAVPILRHISSNPECLFDAAAQFSPAGKKMRLFLTR